MYDDYYISSKLDWNLKHFKVRGSVADVEFPIRNKRNGMVEERTYLARNQDVLVQYKSTT